MNSIKICLQGAFTTVKAFHSLMTLNTLGTFVLMLSSFHFPTSIVPAEAMAMMPRPSMSTRLNPVTVNLGVVADLGAQMFGIVKQSVCTAPSLIPCQTIQMSALKLGQGFIMVLES